MSQILLFDWSEKRRSHVKVCYVTSDQHLPGNPAQIKFDRVVGSGLNGADIFLRAADETAAPAFKKFADARLNSSSTYVALLAGGVKLVLAQKLDDCTVRCKLQPPPPPPARAEASTTAMSAVVKRPNDAASSEDNRAGKVPRQEASATHPLQPAAGRSLQPLDAPLQAQEQSPQPCLQHMPPPPPPPQPQPPQHPQPVAPPLQPQPPQELQPVRLVAKRPDAGGRLGADNMVVLQSNFAQLDVQPGAIAYMSDVSFYSEEKHAKKELVVDEARLPAAAKHAAFCELADIGFPPRFATDYGKLLLTRESPPQDREAEVNYLPATRIWIRIDLRNAKQVQLDDRTPGAGQCINIIMRNDVAKVCPSSPARPHLA